MIAQRGSPASTAKCQPARLGGETASDGDLVEERCDRHPFAPLLIGGNANFGERAVDQVTQAHEASPQHRPGAAVDGDGAPLQGVIREDRRVEQVTGLVSDPCQALGFVG